MLNRMHKLSIQVKSFFIALALMIWAPAMALAQTAAPQPMLKRAPPIWLGLLVMVLLLAIVLAISLMPSKRSHQD